MDFELFPGDLLYSTEVNAPILAIDEYGVLSFCTLLGQYINLDFETIYMIQRPDEYGDGMFWPSRCSIVFDARHILL